MKTRIFFLATIMMIVTACKDKSSDDNSQGAVSKKLMSATWKATNVTRDGVNVTSDFASMTLTVAASTYSTSNGGLAWPSSGSWSFASGSSTEVVRDGAITVVISMDKNATQLSTDFVISTSTYKAGRGNSLQGQYHFDFSH